jgi:hypothetical protein
VDILRHDNTAAERFQYAIKHQHPNVYRPIAALGKRDRIINYSVGHAIPMGEYK